MPFPLIPLIGAAASLGGTLLGNIATSQANKASERFQWNMYDKQRADAIADRDQQNAYNSPMAQMQRFKEAGLNPNLIYNQQTQGAVARSSSGGAYQAKAQDYSQLGGIVGQVLNSMLQEKQLTNQQKLIELREKELKSKDVAIDRNKLAFNLDKEMYAYTLEGKDYANRKLLAEKTLIDNRDKREWIAQGIDKNKAEAIISQIGQSQEQSKQAVQESIARIEAIRANIGLTGANLARVNALTENLFKTGDILDYEIKLNNMYLKQSTVEKIIGTVVSVAGGLIGGKKGGRAR